MAIRKAKNELTARSGAELDQNQAMRELLAARLPDLGDKWDIHLPTFLTAPALARLLWLDSVYRQIVDVPGAIVEFGSQWGASLNALAMLRMIHEPWNAGRHIASFSTFEDGFVGASRNDGRLAKSGDYATKRKWRGDLQTLLDSHTARSPVPARVEIVDGDVRKTFAKWLDASPHVVIALAHFDMDIYAPTRDALALCLKRMPKGGVLVFDELNCPPFPGETKAVDEVLGIAKMKLRKSPYQPYSAYCVIE